MILTIFFLISLALQVLPCQSFDIPPETVSSLDPDAYLGFWYQMYASLIPNKTFESNGFCVTANYFNPSVTEEKVEFTIINSQNMNSFDGEKKRITGKATNDDPKDEPGKYSIDFAGVPREGNYWIIAVGDKDGDQYPWAVVSSPFKLQLFILARNVNEFREKYEEEVLKLVKDQGFDKDLNKPLETYQGDDCAYSG